MKVPTKGDYTFHVGCAVTVKANDPKHALDEAWNKLLSKGLANFEFKRVTFVEEPPEPEEDEDDFEDEEVTSERPALKEEE